MGGWNMFGVGRIYAIYNIGRQKGRTESFGGKRCDFFFNFYCYVDMELISFTFWVVLATTIATLFHSGWLIIASEDPKDHEKGVKWLVVCVYSLIVLTIVLKIIE